jgi:hypothetical protein
MHLVLRPEHADFMLFDQEASTQVHTIPRKHRILDVDEVGPFCEFTENLGQQRPVGGNEAQLLLAAPSLRGPSRP